MGGVASGGISDDCRDLSPLRRALEVGAGMPLPFGMCVAGHKAIGADTLAGGCHGAVFCVGVASVDTKSVSRVYGVPDRAAAERGVARGDVWFAQAGEHRVEVGLLRGTGGDSVFLGMEPR